MAEHGEGASEESGERGLAVGFVVRGNWVCGSKAWDLAVRGGSRSVRQRHFLSNGIQCRGNAFLQLFVITNKRTTNTG
jgi:hypothetical protein